MESLTTELTAAMQKTWAQIIKVPLPFPPISLFSLPNLLIHLPRNFLILFSLLYLT